MEEVGRKDIDYSNHDGDVVHRVKKLYDHFHEYVRTMDNMDQALTKLMYGIDAILYDQAGYSLLKKKGEESDKKEVEDKKEDYQDKNITGAQSSDMFINIKLPTKR